MNEYQLVVIRKLPKPFKQKKSRLFGRDFSKKKMILYT